MRIKDTFNYEAVSDPDWTELLSNFQRLRQITITEMKGYDIDLLDVFGAAKICASSIQYLEQAHERRVSESVSCIPDALAAIEKIFSHRCTVFCEVRCHWELREVSPLGYGGEQFEEITVRIFLTLVVSLFSNIISQYIKYHVAPTSRKIVKKCSTSQKLIGEHGWEEAWRKEQREEGSMLVRMVGCKKRRESFFLSKCVVRSAG